MGGHHLQPESFIKGCSAQAVGQSSELAFGFRELIEIVVVKSIFASMPYLRETGLSLHNTKTLGVVAWGATPRRAQSFSLFISTQRSAHRLGLCP